MQGALRQGLSDVDSETRSLARKAFWAYADHFKLESDLILSSVERETAGDTAGDNASVLSHRSRQSSIARSTESIDSQVINFEIIVILKAFIYLTIQYLFSR